jgi:hypothetical protein
MTDAQSWQNTHDVLLRAGLLDTPVPDLDAAYTNRFVKERGN